MLQMGGPRLILKVLMSSDIYRVTDELTHSGFSFLSDKKPLLPTDQLSFLSCGFQVPNFLGTHNKYCYDNKSEGFKQAHLNSSSESIGRFTKLPFSSEHNVKVAGACEPRC